MESLPLPTRKDRVAELDLLRFIAALSVVLFHYSFRGHAADNLSTFNYPPLIPVAKYGFLGVELFFMISGFVILMTAMSGSAKRFFISRAVRLYPAFWFACTLTFVVSLLAHQPQFPVTFPQYAANMTMLSGFFRIHDIDGVYWSLRVEIQFYAFVLVILALGQIKRVEPILWAWLALTVAYALKPIAHVEPLFLFESAPYFVAGATYYLIRQSGWTPVRVAVVLVSYAAAVRLAWLGNVRTEAHYHQVFSHTVLAVVIALIFGTFALVASRKTSGFSQGWWLSLGALTYPMYLIHHNSGFILLNVLNGRVNPHILMWGMVLLVMLVAYAINQIVERGYSKPFKRLLERLLYGKTRLPVAAVPVRSAYERD